MLDANNVVVNQNLIDAWTQRDVDARAIIYCNIEPQQQIIVEGCQTAADMWDRLILQYAQAAAINANLVTAKFFDYRYNPAHRVMDHITKFTNMAEELRNLQAPVTEQQVIVRIISTLPPSFRSFRSAWQSIPIAEQTIPNLTTRLVGEEALNNDANRGEPDPADTAFFAAQTRTQPQPQANNEQERPTDNHPDNAFAARGGGRGQHNTGGHSGYRRGGFRGNGRSFGQSNGGRGGYQNSGRGGRSAHNNDSNQPTITCFTCGGVGHKSYQCPSKREEDRREARSDNYNKNRNNGNSFGCISSSFCLVACHPRDWYADSGATRHMTDQRSFFTHLTEIPAGTWKVNGIGGAQLQALAIGHILVTSFVDDQEFEGEFRDVLYVPNLGMNLFSIGAATARGTDVLFTDKEVLNVFKSNCSNSKSHDTLNRSSSQKTTGKSWLARESENLSTTFMSSPNQKKNILKDTLPVLLPRPNPQTP